MFSFIPVKKSLFKFRRKIRVFPEMIPFFFSLSKYLKKRISKISHYLLVCQKSFSKTPIIPFFPKISLLENILFILNSQILISTNKINGTCGCGKNFGQWINGWCVGLTTRINIYQVSLKKFWIFWIFRNFLHFS